MPDTPAKRRLQGRHRRRFAGIPAAAARPIKKTSLVLGETRQQVTDKGRRKIEDTR
jgi:hypothetical protein